MTFALRRAGLSRLDAALLLLAPPALLSADVVVLKDGTHVAGDEVSEEADAYRIKTKYGLLNVPKETVAEVVRAAPLVEQARSFRMGGAAMLKKAEQREGDPEMRKLDAESARESLKQALALFTKARSASFGADAEGLDRVIAGVEEELARCRDLAGPDALVPVAPPKAPDAAPVVPPPARPAAVVPVAPPPCLPVPSPEDRKRAEAQIRDLFKADFGRRDPADQQALAARLIRESEGTRDDAAARYVLLLEARDLAARAGDPATALAAVDRMAQGFRVDALALKQEALDAAGRSVRTPEAAAVLADGCLAAADEAAAADDYDAAVSLATKAESAGRRAGDAYLSARARDARQGFESTRGRYRLVKADAETLKEKPEDPDANSAVGRFCCLEKGDWKRGLPMLARGSDAGLKELAKQDLANPANVAGQTALGDAWWEAGEKIGGAAKSSFRERAVHWYRTAARKASGLARTRLQGRIAEHEKESAPPAPSGAAAGAVALFNGRDLSAWVDKSGERAAWPVVGGVLETGRGNILTRARFQDVRLHVEFCMEPESDSGVYLQGLYEVNIRSDPWTDPPSLTSSCGAIVGLKAPDKNAVKPPGVWQAFDIVFRAARFGGEKKTASARVTVLLNGVKIHDDVEVRAPTSLAAGTGESAEPGPLLLQSYAGKVRFRNIWIAPMR